MFVNTTSGRLTSRPTPHTEQGGKPGDGGIGVCALTPSTTTEATEATKATVMAAKRAMVAEGCAVLYERMRWAA